MTDAAFFEAILADPHDRALPLVYADWLEERGDPRGEFVRLQAELATWERTDPRRPEREPRLWELLQRLLPLPNVLIEPAAFTIPIEVIERVPESVAREDCVFPLHCAAGAPRLLTLVAPPGYPTVDSVARLEFIFGYRVQILPARREQVEAQITEYYGRFETVSVDCILYDFADVGR